MLMQFLACVLVIGYFVLTGSLAVALVQLWRGTDERTDD